MNLRKFPLLLFLLCAFSAYGQDNLDDTLDKIVHQFNSRPDKKYKADDTAVSFSFDLMSGPIDTLLARLDAAYRTTVAVTRPILVERRDGDAGIFCSSEFEFKKEGFHFKYPISIFIIRADDGFYTATFHCQLWVKNGTTRKIVNCFPFNQDSSETTESKIEDYIQWLCLEGPINAIASVLYEQ